MSNALLFPARTAAIAAADAAIAARDLPALLAAARDGAAAAMSSELLEPSGETRTHLWDGYHDESVTRWADAVGLIALAGDGAALLAAARATRFAYNGAEFGLGALVDAAEAAAAALAAAGLPAGAPIGVRLDLMLADAALMIAARLAAGDWRPLAGSPGTAGRVGKHYRIFEDALATFARGEDPKPVIARVAKLSPILAYVLWVEAAKRGHQPPPAYRF